MSRQIVPIANIQRRIPEAGRIRIGEKVPTRNGKSRPSSISKFRFTSHDEAALDQIAAMYGGTVKPWSDERAAAGQFEVTTNAPEIRIILPPDPLGSTPIYELWGGGGCERRCDGVSAAVLQQGPDGLEPIDVPCICRAKGEAECKMTTHLTVILPEIRFAGVWRLTTHSENAGAELPGMVELIQGLQGQGLSYAVLAIRQRRSVTAGETKLYNVPVLGVPESIEQLQSGALRLGSLPPGQPPTAALGVGVDGLAVSPAAGGGDAPPLPAAPSAPANETSGAGGVHPTGSSAAEAPPASDDVIDAEVIDPAPEVEVELPDDPMTEQQMKAMHSLLRSKAQATGPGRFPVLTKLLGREITTTKQLSKADAGHVIEQLQAVKS